MPYFELAAREVLVDQPLLSKVCDLVPNSLVTVRAEFCDDFAQTWASHAAFITDENGEINVRSAKPQLGTYEAADVMGLFWSMQLQTDNPSTAIPFPNTVTKSLQPLSVTLKAQQEGQTVAEAVVIRKFLADGVAETTLHEGKFIATLFVPNIELAQAPIVLVLGGSGGGFGWSHQVAALLASQGCISVALAYFDWSGQHHLPKELVEIPLDTFGAVIAYLKSHFRLNLNQLSVIGYSKGAELALLLAGTYPEIKRVVAYAPSSVVWQGLQMPKTAARSSWSYQQRPLPFVQFPDGYFDEVGWRDHAAVAPALIPVEKISGSILLISGTHDGVWPSTKMANMILKRLEDFGHNQLSRHLCFNGAGHNLSVPYLPSVAFDGVAVAVNAAAERQAWQAVKEFLYLPNPASNVG